jgi:hypothetical protein
MDHDSFSLNSPKLVRQESARMNRMGDNGHKGGESAKKGAYTPNTIHLAPETDAIASHIPQLNIDDSSPELHGRSLNSQSPKDAQNAQSGFNGANPASTSLSILASSSLLRSTASQNQGTGLTSGEDGAARVSGLGFALAQTATVLTTTPSAVPSAHRRDTDNDQMIYLDTPSDALSHTPNRHNRAAPLQIEPQAPNHLHPASCCSAHPTYCHFALT